MTREHETARLSDYLDGTLDAAERRTMDAHLATCAECRATLAQLDAVVRRAGTLADTPPSADLWNGIAERIGLGGVASLSRAPRRWSFTLPQLLAAGLALAALGAGAVWLVLSNGHVGQPPQASVPAPTPAPGQPMLVPVSRVRETYDNAVADLERVLAENRDRLDSTTVRVIEESLRSIDRALARARNALAKDPSDTYLNAHLAETMRRKLDLLRRAAALATAQS